MKSDVMSLLRREYDAWRRGAWKLPVPFTDACAPFLFFMGVQPRPDQKKLLIISLEPLQDDATFAPQVALSQSFDDYVSWQLDFFREFPRRTGVGVTKYWAAMHRLACGWLGRSPAVGRARWDVIDEAFSEMPLIPMHARKHAGSWKARRAQVLELFNERIELAIDSGRFGAALVLGSDPASEIMKLPTVTLAPGRLHPDAHVDPSVLPLLGNRFLLPLERAEIRGARGTLPLFLRRAPMSNGWQPTDLGIHELGRVLRAVA
jgi:hypothetical protein